MATARESMLLSVRWGAILKDPIFFRFDANWLRQKKTRELLVHVLTEVAPKHAGLDNADEISLIVLQHVNE